MFNRIANFKKWTIMLLGLVLIPFASAQAAPFLATFRTTTANETITLPLITGYTYNFDIDWGDNSTVDTITSYDQAERTHTYTTAGDHQISITGSMPMWNFIEEQTSREKIISIDDDGDVGFGVGVTDMSHMFHGASSLTTVPLFDTSSVTSMGFMFYGASSLTTVPLFDTSSVTSMGSMFYGASSLTTVPLFDTSSVTYMVEMFLGASSLTTVPLFNTSSVADMRSMFWEASSLTTVPLFDVSALVYLPRMPGTRAVENIFYGASALTEGALSGLRYSIDYSDTVLEAAALRDVLDNLGTADGSRTLTLTRNPGLDDLVAEDYVTALAKGWTIVPTPPVPETCDDGIQNQDETGIDTGGVCEEPASACLTYTSSYFSNIFFYDNSTLGSLTSALMGYFYYDCESNSYSSGNESEDLEAISTMTSFRKTTAEVVIINTNKTATLNQNYYDEDTKRFKKGQENGSLEDVTSAGRVLDTAGISGVSGATEGSFYYNSTDKKFYVGNASGNLEILFTVE